MTDEFYLPPGRSIVSSSDRWYQCLQTLGEGKNAVVFLMLATSHAQQGSLFAIKVFKRQSSSASRRRFFEELEFLRDCDHPSVMRLVDHGLYSGKYPFMLVEYLPTTLRSAMSRGLSQAEKVCYVLQLLSALQFLSERTPPVIHGDIKPENIFIKGRSCVLGDFGLLRRADGSLWNDTEEPPMPSRYRTPDLVRFGRGESSLTERSDWYQLGLVIAELFSGCNPQEPLASGQSRLSEIRINKLGTIPGEKNWKLVASLISRMLKDDPLQRPSPKELLDLWRGVLMNVLKLSEALEGALFPSWMATR